jgi:hypothetical protein
MVEFISGMCRMIGAGVGVGVGVGIVPESAALRNRDRMQPAMIELREPWSLCKRNILVREQWVLPDSIKHLTFPKKSVKI